MEKNDYAVQNPVLIATWWLHEHQKEMVCYYFDSYKPLLVLVGTERFELSTYGLRVYFFNSDKKINSIKSRT